MDQLKVLAQILDDADKDGFKCDITPMEFLDYMTEYGVSFVESDESKSQLLEKVMA